MNRQTLTKAEEEVLVLLAAIKEPVSFYTISYLRCDLAKGMSGAQGIGHDLAAQRKIYDLRSMGLIQTEPINNIHLVSCTIEGQLLAIELLERKPRLRALIERAKKEELVGVCTRGGESFPKRSRIEG